MYKPNEATLDSISLYFKRNPGQNIFSLSPRLDSINDAKLWMAQIKFKEDALKKGLRFNQYRLIRLRMEEVYIYPALKDKMIKFFKIIQQQYQKDKIN